MEQHWEHKITNAYRKMDNNTPYPNKDELWVRISSGLAQSKGVALFWKVAAIMLAIVMFSGAFAAITVVNSQKEKLSEIENQNLKLQYTVDSLLRIEPLKTAEIRVVEKEKLIYKEVPVVEDKNETLKSNLVKQENELKNLNEQLLKTGEIQKITSDSLNMARVEIEKLNFKEPNNPDNKKPLFTLKPEKMDPQIQPNLKDEAPKIRLQLFKIQDNIKYDSNSTLLKK